MAEYHERAAKLGGAITKAKYGVSHFATIGRAGGLKVKNRGMDYRAIGKKGAATARANIRNAAFEEAALECLKVFSEHKATGAYPLDMGGLAKECAERIRTLCTK